jgi:integrase/recombinase XerD
MRLSTDELTPAQVQAVLDMMPTGTPLELRDRAIVTALAMTGIKIKELANLTLDRVLADSILTPCGRLCALDFEARQAFSDFFAVRDTFITPEGRKAEGQIALPTAAGRPLGRLQMMLIVRKAGENAGITGHLSPRRLRASLIAGLIAAGLPQNDIEIAIGCRLRNSSGQPKPKPSHLAPKGAPDGQPGEDCPF